jgi:glycosyltransferase involved in cell wall biosynthesis
VRGPLGNGPERCRPGTLSFSPRGCRRRAPRFPKPDRARERPASGHRRRAGYWETEIAPWLGRDGIFYAGPLDDARKSELLGRAAALLVPVAWEEPFGIVFAEALACGTPVISSPRGALPEIVEPGREGFLCADVAELANAIRNIPRIRRADCRARAEAHFSSRAMFRRYEQLYERRLNAA